MSLITISCCIARLYYFDGQRFAAGCDVNLLFRLPISVLKRRSEFLGVPAGRGDPHPRLEPGQFLAGHLINDRLAVAIKHDLRPYVLPFGFERVHAAHWAAFAIDARVAFDERLTDYPFAAVFRCINCVVGHSLFISMPGKATDIRSSCTAMYSCDFSITQALRLLFCAPIRVQPAPPKGSKITSPS